MSENYFESTISSIPSSNQDSNSETRLRSKEEVPLLISPELYAPLPSNSSTSTLISPSTSKFDLDKMKVYEREDTEGVSTARSSIDEKQGFGERIWSGLDGKNVQSWGSTLRNLGKNFSKAWDGEGFFGVTGFSPLPTHISSTFTQLQLQQHRIAIIIYYALLFSVFFALGLFFYLPAKSVTLTSVQTILTSSRYDRTSMNNSSEPSNSGFNKAKILESYSNPYGFSNLIDPYAGGIFNPTILVLPDTVGIGFRHLLVARGPEKYEVIEGDDTRWENLVGCFLLPMKRKYLELPYLARESELETLKLPAERKAVFNRCDDPSFDQFIGAEDPRLFFTNIGQPLLIYSQTGNSPNICRAIFIIDARVVIPGLGTALSRGGWSPPIEFDRQTSLIREDQTNIEKNWAPFLGENDELYFHVSLVPQKIYKYVQGHALRSIAPQSSSSSSTPNSSHNCLSELVGADMDRVKFHQASPLLRVTLCKRGECKPNIHNTVLFAIIHIKYHPLPYLHYERRVVTLNVTAPYEYLSISKPLTYSGTNQADPIFTVSMSWDHPTKKNGLGLNHGYLDDILIISFGVFDYGSAYIDVLAKDLLNEHALCEGTEGSSLWN